jgi:Flp pilus assembly protein TadD
MHKVVVAIALLAACRGNHPARKDAGSSVGSAFSVSVVPTLPKSDDGKAALRSLDREIEGAKEPHQRVALLMTRARLRGALKDYVQALDESGKLVDASDKDVLAWQLRVQALTSVHRFAAAREALARLRQLPIDQDIATDFEATLDDAQGATEAALRAREMLTSHWANAQSLTAKAATLAELARFDGATALIPVAAQKLRNNSADYFERLLFQWGHIYELKGDLSSARDFYEEGYRRLPGSLETVEHLVGVLVATGDTTRAKQILGPAVEENFHPGLRALAVKLGISKGGARPESAADVAAEWERYVAALPEAFSDHAARFYLDVGANPKRALELARQNLANRPTLDARALVV